MALRHEYEQELEQLHEQIISMGAAVETAIRKSTEALYEGRSDLCQQVIDGDDEIDAQEEAINQACVRLIARQQPVARDLRDITASLKLITDLERIADYAESIAGHVLNLQKCPGGDLLTIPDGLKQLADLACELIRSAIDAYVSRNTRQASAVIWQEAKITWLAQLAKEDIIEAIEADPAKLRPYVELLLCSRAYHRCAEHAENVCEWVLYYVEGLNKAELAEGPEETERES